MCVCVWGGGLEKQNSLKDNTYTLYGSDFSRRAPSTKDAPAKTKQSVIKCRPSIIPVE